MPKPKLLDIAPGILTPVRFGASMSSLLGTNLLGNEDSLPAHAKCLRDCLALSADLIVAEVLSQRLHFTGSIAFLTKALAEKRHIRISLEIFPTRKQPDFHISLACKGGAKAAMWLPVPSSTLTEQALKRMTTMTRLAAEQARGAWPAKKLSGTMRICYQAHWNDLSNHRRLELLARAEISTMDLAKPIPPSIRSRRSPITHEVPT